MGGISKQGTAADIIAGVSEVPKRFPAGVGGHRLGPVRAQVTRGSLLKLRQIIRVIRSQHISSASDCKTFYCMRTETHRNP